LTRCRRSGNDRFDVFDEAHVEHAVSFVEHEDLQLRQIDTAAFQVVDQTARRSNQDFRVLCQQHQLLTISDAAQNADGAQTLEVLAIRGSGGGDLHREFAGRRQNQHGRTGNRLRTARAGTVSRTWLTRLAGLCFLQL
jgi:hypothetical protein